MGLFETLFKGRRQPQASGRWETLSAYTPVFTSWDGHMYESELCRASIDALARHSAKLEITVNGSAQPGLRARIKSQPNPFMSWYQFTYRARTILEAQNNCFIVPVIGAADEIEGYFPVLPSNCEVWDVNGEPFLRYTFMSGMTGAISLDDCGILVRHQYKDDFFGEKNTALAATLNLIHMQQQGITEGIKNGATFRFMARVRNFTKPEDLAKERKRFNENNLRGESGGLLLFPSTYDELRQIDQKPYTVDADQMKLIQPSVYNYFGVNEDVLQNKAFGDAWSAFYEGAIEPFAVQLSEVLTAMTYTPRERSLKNSIFFTSNRLQYMSNTDKLNVTAQLVDRGVFNRDEARAVWNLPPLPNGEGKKYVIRGEYKDAADTQNPKGVDTSAVQT